MRFYPDGFPIDAWTDSSYDKWFRAHRASEEELEAQRSSWTRFDIQPTFSFIVPLYKTPSEYLHTMADSVLAQTYPKLQLVLVNASPEVGELNIEIDGISRRDSRVVVVNMERNLGITENTNAGISASTGEFCCFLDHDDYIDPNLLYEYVSRINEMPDTDVLYCDEDLVIKSGSGFLHKNPFIKPDFSPELLLCRNYIVHLMTIRRSLIEGMPRPDVSFDGSQDYNMALFATGEARSVAHIQKVLYHWRISDTSTATNPDSKPYSLRSCRKAIDAQLRRCGVAGNIIGTGLYLLHNIWFEAASAPSVSVVVDLVDCHRDSAWSIEFVGQLDVPSNVEIIVLLDSEDSFSLCPTEYRVVVTDLRSRLGRYNLASKYCGGEQILFLDGDCLFVTPEPIEQLSSLCAVQGMGVSAPKQLYRDGRNKSFGVAVTPERIMPMYRGYEDSFPGYQCNLRAFQNVSAVALQGLCVRRSLFEELGGFDESFGNEAGAVDLCIRVRETGARLAVTPTVKLEIDERCPVPYFDISDQAGEYSAEDVRRFDRKWPGLRSSGDPFLNCNLDQSSNYQQLSREDLIR